MRSRGAVRLQELPELKAAVKLLGKAPEGKKARAAGVGRR